MGAQFDTLRPRLIKIAACAVEMKTMIKIHLPTSCPAQTIMPPALAHMPSVESAVLFRLGEIVGCE